MAHADLNQGCFPLTWWNKGWNNLRVWKNSQERCQEIYWTPCKDCSLVNQWWEWTDPDISQDNWRRTWSNPNAGWCHEDIPWPTSLFQKSSMWIGNAAELHPYRKSWQPQLWTQWYGRHLALHEENCNWLYNWLSSVVFLFHGAAKKLCSSWDKQDLSSLVKSKRTELNAKHLFIKSDAGIMKYRSRYELALQCRRHTRGVAEMTHLISKLIDTFSGERGRVTLGVPLINRTRMACIWEA